MASLGQKELISKWIGNYIHFNAWGEIAYPFPNLSGPAAEVWELVNNFIPYFIGVWLLIHAGIKVNP